MMMNVTPGPPIVEHPRTRSARVATALCGVAVVLSAVGLIAWTGDLLTRPPCEPNYVRLIDIELVAPVASGLLLIVSVIMVAVGRAPGTHRVLFVAATVMVLLTGYLMFGAVLTIKSHQGPYDLGCWTF